MFKKIRLVFCSAIIFSALVNSELLAWGWDTHRYINAKAVDCLPSEMQIFDDHRDYLREHSVDPDQSGLPGYYHYIDIDYYDEFHSETLPHGLDELMDLYGYDVVIDKGTVPWVIEAWTDSLAQLMSIRDWSSVWQIAAELGHFIADSHQPLHLTLNYNGQYTGNDGVHSRYESAMINSHLPDLIPPDSTGHDWNSVIDAVFLYIQELYPYVDNIMAADDSASSQDPSYGSSYYAIMWNMLDTLTIDAIHRAVMDVASIWYTAWCTADRPTTVVIGDSHQPHAYHLYPNYPNPFNPVTIISYDIPQRSDVVLTIYNTMGQVIDILVNQKQKPGFYRVKWNASQVGTGVYFYQLRAGSYLQTRKMVLMK